MGHGVDSRLVPGVGDAVATGEGRWRERKIDHADLTDLGRAICSHEGDLVGRGVERWLPDGWLDWASSQRGPVPFVRAPELGH